jgi:hypothetical protein
MPFSSLGSDSTLHLSLEKNIEGSYSNFYPDNLGNIFLITKSNTIKKLDRSFDSVAAFNDVRRYGNIYLLDVNNPLKILVYYKDFTTILILDRFLSTRNTIDLRRVGILQAKAVAQSYDNNYWVFDELDNTIKKLNDNGDVLMQFADLRTLFSETYNPSRIIDQDGLLYLYDERQGWLLFDYYGSFKQQIPWPNRYDVQVNSNMLSGHDSLYFYTTDKKTFNEHKTRTGIDLSNAIKVQQQLNKIFVLQKNVLSVYSIK